MKCDSCGKIFMVGNRPDGTPNGVGFMLKSGRKIMVCADCLYQVGWMDDAEREAFFARLERKPDNGEVQ